MTSLPVTLVHTGKAEENEDVAARIHAVYPDLPILTAHGEEEIREWMPEAEILFVWKFPMQLLPLATKLRWLQVMGTGLDTLRGTKTPPGVVVTNLRGVFNDAMTEYTLAYMLAFGQDIRRVERQQADRHWQPFPPRMLRGQTVGIIGLGSIGRTIAARCNAFGMRVIGLRRGSEAVEEVERTYSVEEIDAFLPECDFLVSVVPNTPETTNLLNRERIALLKPECVYINIGRGNIVDLDALGDALNAGRIAGAALDVFMQEPLPADHPIWKARNAYITPHISGVNRPEDVTAVFLDNLPRYLKGEPLKYVVDLERGY